MSRPRPRPPTVPEAFGDRQGSVLRSPRRVCVRTLLQWTAVCPRPRSRTGTQAGRSPRASPRKAKPADGQGAVGHTTGNGSARSGRSIRAPKTRAHRNGFLAPARRCGADRSVDPRAAKHRDGANSDAPIDFAVALPLALQPPRPPVADRDRQRFRFRVAAAPAPGADRRTTRPAPVRCANGLAPTDLVPSAAA